jgi:hypothetical protein
VLATLVPAATAHPLLGKREFQQRANAVCAGYTRRLKSIPQPKVQADLVPYLRKSVALARAQTKDLGALKPPAAFVRRFARMQTIGRAETAAAAQVITALQAGDQTRAQSLILRITALDKQYNTAATRIGLTACAKAAPTG